MSFVYSKQLAKVVSAGAGGATFFTAPAGYVTVVRTITLTVFAATTEAAVRLGGAYCLCGQHNASGVDEFLVFNMRHVLNAGDTLDWTATGSGLQILVSGYQLTTP